MTAISTSRMPSGFPSARETGAARAFPRIEAKGDFPLAKVRWLAARPTAAWRNFLHGMLVRPIGCRIAKELGPMGGGTPWMALEMAAFAS